MPATVLVNNLTVVHATSDGVSLAFPDPCKTPTPAGPIPIPYPNVAMSSATSQGSTTVKIDGNPIMLKSSCFSVSSGDEAGTALGVTSSKVKGKAYPNMYSFDVKVEGENVFRLSDLMLQNSGSPANTAPACVMQPNTAVPPSASPTGGKSPLELEIQDIYWSTGRACCGDEVALAVKATNVRLNWVLPMRVKREGVENLARIGVELKQGTWASKWVVARGPYRADVKLVATQKFFKRVQETATPLEVPTVPECEELRGTVPRTSPRYEWDPVLLNMVQRLPDFEWEWTHSIAVKGGELVVTRKIAFKPDPGVSAGQVEYDDWKLQVETVWDRKFKIHRIDCKRKPCACVWKGCCTFPVRIRCEIVAPGNHHGAEVNLGAGRADAQAGGWWYSSQWWEDAAPWTNEVRAHEFGHLIGMYDEYENLAPPVGVPRRGALDPANPLTGTGTIMDNNSNRIEARMLREFHEWFSRKADALIGRTELRRM